MIDELKIPRRCVHCEHWKPEETNQGEAVGECREAPPVVVIRSGEVVSLWPYSAALDWCGRWQLRVDA